MTDRSIGDDVVTDEPGIVEEGTAEEFMELPGWVMNAVTDGFVWASETLKLVVLVSNMVPSLLSTEDVNVYVPALRPFDIVCVNPTVPPGTIAVFIGVDVPANMTFPALSFTSIWLFAP